MKRLIFNFYILFSVGVIFSACHKDAKVVPQDTGTLINDGSLVTVLNSNGGYVLYGGTTVPTAGFGALGAYYLDLTNGTIYGPKTASGWGNGLSLKGNKGAGGPTGATGKPGTRIYAGYGPPPAATGIIGDYFLDKKSVYLYGPKTAAGWGVPVSLRMAGPQGPAGPPGPVGSNPNVFTDVFTMKGSDWLWNSQYVYETSAGSYTEYFTRYYVRKNAKINADVLNNGMVLVYFTPSPVNNPNQWEPLPYQFDSSFGFTYNYVFVPAVGQVTLHYFFIQTDPSSTLPTLSTYNDETRQFKVITVLGEYGTFMLAHHINLNNYKDVSKVTGLWQEDAK